MQFIGPPLEILFSAAFLLITEGVFWPPGSYFGKGPVVFDASDPSSVAAHIGLILFLVIVSIARRESVLDAVRCAWPLLLLVVLAYVSAFWSEAPGLVMRRATTLALTTLFAVYLAARFDMARLVSILVKINAFAVVGSFIVMAIAPKLGLSGIADYPNAWRGAYTAKNNLGGMSAFGIIIAFYALRRGYGSRLIAAVLIPANLALLYLSQSATPLVLLIAAAYAALLASALRRRDAAGFAAGFVLVVIALAGVGVLALGWTDILALLNRSPTLTGRAGIWHMVVEFIGRRPWLGYGYGAFWRHDGLEARTIWDSLLWMVPHSHNAWLEIGLDLGIVGMGGITLLLLAAFYRGVRVLTLPRAQHVVFCLTIFVAILVENLTESAFPRPDTFLWVLFAVAFVYLGREAAAHRGERAASRHRLIRSPLGAAVIPGVRSP